MLLLGFLSVLLGVTVLLFGTFGPRNARLPLERRRPATGEPVTGLTRLTGAASEALARFLERKGWSRTLETALERAGMKLSPADFVILVASSTLLAVLAGALLAGPWLGVLLTPAGPLGAKVLIGVKQGKRRRAFADQLDDTLQLLAGGLRAGHSLLRAIDAVSHEADSPTAEEFARVVNETRLGRDLNDALDQTALRMQSEDFSWVAQAIGVHREVGGDLSEVLDEVGHTIRERNQIRRQVLALSAEGKMSAYVLLALPLVVLGILMLTSPSYVVRFVESPLGFVMMGAAVVMMVIGSLWLRKIVSFKF
ncbi:MAG: type secretion system protein [Cryobacterium sp.]|jgi:tight adherence protein B|nr:type secretion system protein [Cryobacterium sp.]